MTATNSHCDTHFIALYDGLVPNDKKLATVCGSKKTELIFKGPNLLLEFNAGVQVPPFDYNGFSANLEFIEGPSTTIPPTSSSASHQTFQNHSSHHRHGSGSSLQILPPALTDLEWTPAPPKFSPCDKIIIEANGRSGHFDTRGRPFAPNCRLIFKGKATDVVHISLFNYRLKAQACRSVIEIVDGALESAAPPGTTTNHKRSIHKMCSPITRHARKPDGNFLKPETFKSSGSQIMIALRRFQSSSQPGGAGPADYNDEFIDGAYMFHDGKWWLLFFFLVRFNRLLLSRQHIINCESFPFAEEESGTLQPERLCNADHYGLSSPSFGSISSPGSEHLFWNIEGELNCTHNFVPAANQSVTITVSATSFIHNSHLIFHTIRNEYMYWIIKFN